MAKRKKIKVDQLQNVKAEIEEYKLEAEQAELEITVK